MKKALVIIIFFLSLSLLFAVTPVNKLSVKEELSYNGLNNRGPYSVGFNRFSVNTISANTEMNITLDFFSDYGLGVVLTAGIGYQKDIYSFDRFASIPEIINSKVMVGMAYKFREEISLSLAGGIRTNFMLSRSLWLSQLGGSMALDYYFANSFNCSLSASYWYNTNYRSVILGVGFGYSFEGGTK